jgi:hypothetical protein
MVKVKIIKLPNGVPEDDKYLKLGQEYEAFELRDEECGSDFYKHYYALNIGCGIFHISPDDVEVVEDSSFIVPPQPTPEELDKILKGIKSQGVVQVPKQTTKILLCEDGSVIEEDIKKLGIPYIIYKKGGNPPHFLEF